MESPENRRDFLKKGGAVAAGVIAAVAQEPAQEKPAPGGPEARKAQVPRQEGVVESPVRSDDIQFEGKYDLPEEFKLYDRYYPSYGGTEDSKTYLGKMVPGLRASGLPPSRSSSPTSPDSPGRWSTASRSST